MRRANYTALFAVFVGCAFLLACECVHGQGSNPQDRGEAGRGISGQAGENPGGINPGQQDVLRQLDSVFERQFRSIRT
ncbi:MAG: hypothetical protein P4L51_20640 [Puia sp.]|nr:hypothetical protein [Puia sp.]